MKDSRLSLAEAARRLRRLADDLEKGRVQVPEGTLRLPKQTKAALEVESARTGDQREVEVELELSFPEPGRSDRARQAVLGRSTADWARSGASVVVLLPALISTVRTARSFRRRLGGRAQHRRNAPGE
jgi:amphi-Trp domain-containing protein